MRNFSSQNTVDLSSPCNQHMLTAQRNESFLCWGCQRIAWILGWPPEVSFLWLHYWGKGYPSHPLHQYYQIQVPKACFGGRKSYTILVRKKMRYMNPLHNNKVIAIPLLGPCVPGPVQSSYMFKSFNLHSYPIKKVMWSSLYRWGNRAPRLHSC